MCCTARLSRRAGMGCCAPCARNCRCGPRHIGATLEITREARLSNDAYAALEQCLASDRQVVELIGVVATYNMVSRFLVALGIEVE